MKTLITIAILTAITISAHAGTRKVVYRNYQSCYGQPYNQVYYPHQNSYVTPPVYVKTDLYRPPVIMRRAVTNSPNGYSSQTIISRPSYNGYPNNW